MSEDDDNRLDAITRRYGEVIIDARFAPSEAQGSIEIWFSSGRVRLFDDGRYCCEERFFSTDDDLSLMKGETLVRVEVADGPTERKSDGQHEVQFMRLVTDRATYVIASHNDHNGYYEGIEIAAEEIA